MNPKIGVIYPILLYILLGSISSPRNVNSCRHAPSVSRFSWRLKAAAAKCRALLGSGRIYMRRSAKGAADFRGRAKESPPQLCCCYRSELYGLFRSAVGRALAVPYQTSETLNHLLTLQPLPPPLPPLRLSWSCNLAQDLLTLLTLPCLRLALPQCWLLEQQRDSRLQVARAWPSSRPQSQEASCPCLYRLCPLWPQVP